MRIKYSGECQASGVTPGVCLLSVGVGTPVVPALCTFISSGVQTRPFFGYSVEAGSNCNTGAGEIFAELP